MNIGSVQEFLRLLDYLSGVISGLRIPGMNVLVSRRIGERNATSEGQSSTAMKYQIRKPGEHEEKKREIWRSKIDKPIGPGMLVTLVPTLIMCVFLVMAAPYLKSFTLKFFEMDREEVLLPIELAGESETILPAVPPPNPDIAIAELYQKQFDEQGFDWRTPPEIEIPEEKKEEIKKEIKMVDVELPLLSNPPKIEVEPIGAE